MGIRISHSEPVSRSGLTIANLGQHLADVLPAHDWRKIRHLFDGTFADIAHIRHREAGQYAQILRRAATDPRMPANWGDLADIFAAAAQRAANAREPWVWS
ncbi:hypothetical protein ACIQ7D_17810 [Streptomyces sp. NPDC096310]|uniref:DUF7739 domain-containing protein n=1 Tax=Streptomyces sp. NPDC096310 TaxID=3366082 RepID=UPI0038293A5F